MVKKKDLYILWVIIYPVQAYVNIGTQDLVANISSSR